jgi:hypothetical protein
MKRLALVLAALMTATIGFFAWLRAKDKANIDRDLSVRRRHLNAPDLDPDFAHDLTPADPVQAFRDGGAV